MERKNTISACLVVYNEEKLIERCLESIENLVDEIIIVHDGECKDNTLEIAERYTDKIFIKPHIGIAEPLRSFTYEQAKGEWILQIDADEYFYKEDVQRIKKILSNTDFDGYWLKWELWDGEEPIHFRGLQKLCFFRKNSISYQGLPQTAVTVNGKVGKADIFLRHRPNYENISWKTANAKRKYWLESHVKYFFPELVEYHCFNDIIDSWVDYTKKVRRNPLFYLIFYPLKNFLGQLKNGSWKSRTGFNIALQQYVYYFSLYWIIWKMTKKLK